MRRLIFAIALVAASVVATGTPTQAAGTELAGTTTITSSVPVSVPVTISGDNASVRCLFWESAVTFSGEGRFVALLLAPMASTWESRNRPIMWGRVPEIADEDATFDMVGCWGSKQHLPPGDYRLTLIPDGQPVTATLEINGLAGSVDLAPTARDDGVRVAYPEPSFSGMPGEQLYAAGADGTIDEGSNGMLFRLGWAPHSVSAARLRGDCFREGGTGAHEPLAEAATLRADTGVFFYGPSCDFGGGSESLSFDGVDFSYSYKFPVEPGTYGIGGWQAGVGVQDSVGSVALWISSPVTTDYWSTGSGSGCCFDRR